jgi:hypothetical protein
MLLANLSKCHGGYRSFFDLVSGRPVKLRQPRGQGGPARSSGYPVEGQTPGRVRNRQVQVDIARTGNLKGFKKPSLRLDVDSMPAPVVKELRHRLCARICGSDIHIEAVFGGGESSRKDDVLRVLSVRDGRRRLTRQ